MRARSDRRRRRRERSQGAWEIASEYDVLDQKGPRASACVFRQPVADPRPGEWWRSSNSFYGDVSEDTIPIRWLSGTVT
jgi:hypothetical protein